MRVPITIQASLFLVGTIAAQGGGALPPVPAPPQNPVTAEKAVLGKILFWDEQLSSDDTMACGTCHLPEANGADPRFGTHPGFDGLLGRSTIRSRPRASSISTRTATTTRSPRSGWTSR